MVIGTWFREQKENYMIKRTSKKEKELAERFVKVLGGMAAMIDSGQYSLQEVSEGIRHFEAELGRQFKLADKQPSDTIY